LANSVLMLHTVDAKQQFGNDEGQRGRWVDLFVRKNRSGSLGAVKFEFFGYNVTFKEKYWNEAVMNWDFKEEVSFKNTKAIVQSNTQDNIQVIAKELDIDESSLPF